MLITVKELSERLRIKPSTLYAWAKAGRIPSVQIFGLVRFKWEAIEAILAACERSATTPQPVPHRKQKSDVDTLIARVKAQVYTPAHGETRPKSSLIGKEDADGAV